MNNFLTRTFTGFFLVLIVMGSFMLHPISFILIGLVIVAGIQLELTRIISQNNDHRRDYCGLIVSGFIYILVALYVYGFIGQEWLLMILLIIPLLFIRELYNKHNNHMVRIAVLIFSIIYSTLPYVLMLFASFGESGMDTILAYKPGNFNAGIVVGFFILLWINDSGAYLAGVSFGKHRLFERISPKKSWEGFAGGLFLTLGCSLFMPLWLDFYTRPDWLVIALLVSIGSTYGDLFESMIKRDAGLKDSGSILPGHGGFMDRFDGVTLAFPLVFLYITFFA